jgi:hypothetical protein
MNMPALRHSAPLRRIAWQQVPFHNRDGPVEVGKHPSREQSTHACPKDNSPLTHSSHAHLRFRHSSNLRRALTVLTEYHPAGPGCMRNRLLEFLLGIRLE